MAWTLSPSTLKVKSGRWIVVTRKHFQEKKNVLFLFRLFVCMSYSESFHRSLLRMRIEGKRKKEEEEEKKTREEANEQSEREKNRAACFGCSRRREWYLDTHTYREGETNQGNWLPSTANKRENGG